MISKLKIGGINLIFVFRHKWDDKSRNRFNSEFRTYDLGIFFRKARVVGSKNFENPNEWNKNIVNDYMVGINLLVCKMWINFNMGGMSV